jgi:hypothetical protein
MTDINDLTEMIRNLSPDLQLEVEHYIRDLQERERTRGIENQFKLDWRGAGKGLDGGKSSVDLQHEALDHWGD